MNMKPLKLYINEALHVNRNTKGDYYNYHPKTKDELIKLVDKLIKERGLNADLNDIDTSEITDMSYMFYASKFNGDISKWDVSNVTNMRSMFYQSQFNGDMSEWDVSNVKDRCEEMIKETKNKCTELSKSNNRKKVKVTIKNSSIKKGKLK